MARPKTRSDELYNARRRARRAIERIDRDIQAGGYSDDEIVAAQQYVEYLRSSLKNTYVGRVSNPQLLGEVFDRAFENFDMLQSEVQSYSTSSDKLLWQRNRLMMNEMRLASRGELTSLGELGQAKVKIFFRATQEFWDDRSIAPKDRYEAILKGMGETDLRVAFDKVMAMNPKALKLAEEGLRGVKNTDGLSASDDIDGSPIYIHAVIMLTRE